MNGLVEKAVKQLTSNLQFVICLLLSLSLFHLLSFYENDNLEHQTINVNEKYLYQVFH